MQVSKACRAALSCCDPCLDVELHVKGSESLETVAGFASWVQENGHLVKTLRLGGDDDEPEPGLRQAAESMISLALKLSATTKAPLRLEAFVTNFPSFRSGLISSLPASSMTSLHLKCVNLATLQHPGLDASLQQLVGLRELTLDLEYQYDEEAA
jgi:hypothetical protein